MLCIEYSATGELNFVRISCYSVGLVQSPLAYKSSEQKRFDREVTKWKDSSPLRQTGTVDSP